MTSTPDRVRLAELVATISLGTDLGLGQPMEHVLRHTLVSLRMAELLSLDVAERNVAYYAGLLCWVGCHTDAYEQATWFGDDIATIAISDMNEAVEFYEGKLGLRSAGDDDPDGAAPISAAAAQPCTSSRRRRLEPRAPRPRGGTSRTSRARSAS